MWFKMKKKAESLDSRQILTVKKLNQTIKKSGEDIFLENNTRLFLTEDIAATPGVLSTTQEWDSNKYFTFLGWILLKPTYMTF